MNSIISACWEVEKMTRLLRAGFFRLAHSRGVRFCFVLTLICAFLFAREVRQEVSLGEIWFLPQMMIYAVMFSLAVGREMGHRAKNKLIAGVSRSRMYWSELAAALGVAAVCYLLFSGIVLLANLRLLEHTPISLILWLWLGFGGITLGMTAVFVTVSLLAPAKTLAAVLCLVLVTALYVTALPLGQMLGEPEFHAVAGTVGGKPFYREEPNPDYVAEPWRSVLELYRAVNPFAVREDFGRAVHPFLFYGESWERAKAATAETMGPEFMERMLTEEEVSMLRRAPLCALAHAVCLVLAGWPIFCRRGFR